VKLLNFIKRILMCVHYGSLYLPFAWILARLLVKQQEEEKINANPSHDRFTS
jgi:hypothetical protein